MSIFDWMGKSRTPPLLSMMQRFWLGPAFLLTTYCFAAYLTKTFSNMSIWWVVVLWFCFLLVPIGLFQRLVGEFNGGQPFIGTESWSKGRLMRAAVMGLCAGHFLNPFGNLDAVWQLPISMIFLGWLFESTIGHKFPISPNDPIEGNFPFGVNK